jgi:GT2 family glycosyltransferase
MKKNKINLKKQPLVCIVIVNWNGGENITNCLNSLKMTDYNNFKIIVLDNSSSDDSVQRIKKFKEVDLIISRKNLGFTAGSNKLYRAAIKKYGPDYVCNMNNDIITIQKKWLTLMVEELEKDKDRGICGNKLTFPDGRLQLLYLDRLPKEYNEKDEGQYDFVREVSAVGGANILIKTKVLKTIGGTDENYFYGPDDIDYCFRARKAGFKIVYNGFSKSIHVGSFSYNKSSKDFIYKHQSYGMMIFSFRHDKKYLAIKMVLNQFLRIFFTRKNPFAKITLKNIFFHISFPKRIIYFFTSLVSALINYKKVRQDNYI